MKHVQANRSHRFRPTRRLLSCALTGCLALGAVPLASAQSTSATLRGQVSGAGEGATVTVTNTSTGLSRAARVGADGSYIVGGLPPGPYKVDVVADGAATSKELTLQVGQTATLNLEGAASAAVTPGGQAKDLDAVKVTAPPVIAETKTSEVATYVSQAQIQALPQASRNFLAFADTVPGMIFEQSSDGSARLRSGAQSSTGTNVFIDGVGQKNYVLPGGVSGQDSSSGNPFPQLAIGEYKVITSNYKAEYDQVSSAAVTALTKSGTNAFEGHFFRDYTTGDWRAPTYAESQPGQEKVDSSEEQYGASFGGPIVRDKLFFFATYEAKRIDRPRTVRVGDSAFDPADLTPELADYLGPATVPFKQDNYFGKLTWQANENNLVELSAKIRDESELTNVGDGPNVYSYGSDKTNDSKRFDLRWQFSNENWLNDLHLTREDDAWSPRPIGAGPGYEIRNNRVNNTDGEAILNLGGGPDYQDKRQKGNGLQNDLTFFGWEGHTLKGGVKYKDVEVGSLQRNPANPQYRVDYYENLAEGRTTLADFVPYRVSFQSSLPGRSDEAVTSKNKQFGIYLQDDWQVTDKLELNLGVRYDYEKTPAYQDFVTPAGLVTALRGWSNIANTDYDINDYISTGSNRKADKNNWAPRFGFSYDLAGDQRHVIFGGAGRSFDRNLFDYLALEQLSTSFAPYTYNFDTAAHPCTVGQDTCLAWDPSYFDPARLDALAAANPNLGSEVTLLNNHLKTPYSDQFSIGMRNIVDLGGVAWNTSVAIAHVRSYDGLLFTGGNRYPDGSFHGDGAQWANYAGNEPIPGYGNLILVDNGIDTKLNQLLLSADKPYSEESPWGVTIAYTFSDAKENRLSSADTGEHYLFDLPNLDGQPFLRSAGVPRQRLVVTGMTGFWGINLSSKLTLATPEPLAAVDCRAGTGDCRFASYTPDHTLGFKQLDLALEKVFDTGTDIKMRIRGDVFNVFNWKNFTQYNTDYTSALLGTRNGTETQWPPRMFKLSFGLDW
ncbi:TonB-dependent receptor [Pseudoxanthomonas sp. X-1]|uniref:TonB-dependent receptor n=1 Tax=Pseudoxanthomonas sp. X-1 TaxID=2571115 RepID=UPI00110C19AC|nr:TonB-dependent receptor [Pseudoxanthomonas sp. X-1]TMN18155.1 TonB-dependent receptor [Pseudoxanthomonas sp. X-1]UAY76345.1 TonB-dependent receptor [Pseudoxanthomonas sp. X-1]